MKRLLLRFTLVFCLCSVFFSKTYCDESFLVQNEQETYGPYIVSLINYLNNQPERTHFYTFQSLLGVEKQSNEIVRLVLDIQGECNSDVSSCTSAIFTCSGLVKGSNENFETRPGIICQPKQFFEEVASSTTETLRGISGDGSNEASQGLDYMVPVAKETTESSKSVEEKTISVHHSNEPCLGCPIDLNPNIKGIEELVNTALYHVESERTRRHLATKVVRIQQQIVAGVKYILLLEIVPTICAKDVKKVTTCPYDSNHHPELCEITFYQRPWISKRKDVIENNCTVTQEFTGLEDLKHGSENDGNNEQNINIENGKKEKTVKAERTVDLSDLESQIIVEGIEEHQHLPVSKSASDVMTEQEGILVHQLNRVPHYHSSTKDSAPFNKNMFYQEDEPHDNTNSSDDSTEEIPNKKGRKSKYNHGHVSHFRGGTHHHDNSASIDTTTKDDCIKHLKNSDDSSSNSDSSNIRSKKCKERDSHSVDDCKENSRKHKTINCDESSSSSSSEECEYSKKLKRQRRSFGEQQKREARKRPRLGGINSVPVDDSTIKNLTEHALQYYDSQIGGEYKSIVLEILEASKQLVSGYLYRIKVQIAPSDCLKNSITQQENCNQLSGSESYQCNIKVWDEPWRKNGKQTNITCNVGGEPLKYSFRSKRETNLEFSYKPKNVNDYVVNLSIFKEFMTTYGKTYENNDEFKKRYRIFRQNMKKVRMLNKYEQGTATYGPTQFADLTEAEYKMYLGYKPELRNENNINLPQATIPDIEIPPEFDWRSKHVVAEVKNQGGCGSCWAFSVTGNIEGQYALKYGKLLEFSEQELVDCDSTDEGCGGGLMDNAYRAIEKLGGLETEQDYPYEGEDEKCHFNKSLVQVKVTGALNISQDESEMAQWLVKNGPISIAINANAMQFYFGGVSHPWKVLCNPQSLDHGVLIVGYGVHKYPYFNKTLPYWIVKNSWGKSWGQQGYYLVYRGDGTCGLNQEPTSAIIE